MRLRLLIKFTFLGLFFLVITMVIIKKLDVKPIQWQLQQFLTIEQKLNYFELVCNRLPPSEALDIQKTPYCGAMKLCEALVGQDVRGFRKDSVFRADGLDIKGVVHLYSEKPIYNNMLNNSRVYPWTGKLANVHTLAKIFGIENTKPFEPSALVLCDVYKRELPNRIEISMPVLYYKAKVNCNIYDVRDLAKAFNYADNYSLLALGIPWESSIEHPMFVEPKIFYQIIWQKAHVRSGEFINTDSYVLISGGKDGIYGTEDDECFLKRP